jgi:hypothetical protein
MISTLRSLRRRAQGGSILVEFAIIVPILIVCLTVPLFLARIFWYYSVAQKATHDAARFLSTATQAEMRTLGSGGGEASAAALARWIAYTESEVLQGVTTPLWIYVECGVPTGSSGFISYGNCGFVVPQTVRVHMEMGINDDIFPEYTFRFFGENGLRLTADVTMRYAGN